MFSFLQKINSKKTSNSSTPSNASAAPNSSKVDLVDSYASLRKTKHKKAERDLSLSRNEPDVSRKTNISLASLSSGYFTTGRFHDKKKSSSSLGT